MTTISLKLPDDLAARLDAAAKDARKSRSEFAREALLEKLKDRETGKKPSLYELTKDLCGIGDSGLGDLSTNRKYLEGFGG